MRNSLPTDLVTEPVMIIVVNVATPAIKLSDNLITVYAKSKAKAGNITAIFLVSVYCR